MEDKEQIGLNWLIKGATKKGYLQKQGGSNKGWKKRWFCVKANELFYFETSDETKLQGKFVIEIDYKVNEVDDKKLKKDFCFKLEGKNLKQPRFLAAESDKQRKEWIATIESILSDIKSGKLLSVEGMLSKQGPKRLAWKRRFCVLKGGEFLYYRQQKDLLPVGIINMDDCKSLEPGTNETGKPFSFILVHPNRKYYFYADSQGEMDLWTTAIRTVMGLKGEMQTAAPQVPREVFLCKALKEGILNKQKKNSSTQIKKTKIIRAVLTSNFLYYFPQTNSNDKYHTIHLDGSWIEQIPASVEKMPFSFRVVNFLHPLYLGAEDEKEFNVWIQTLEKVQKHLELNPESSTDSDIKTNTNIDYSIEVISEKIDKTQKVIGDCKIYEIRVKAFWTHWVVEKTYNEIYELYSKLLQKFPTYIFPEATEEPLYTSEITSDGNKRGVGGRRNKLLLTGSGKVQEPFDSAYDLKFVRCLLREILRNRSVSQCDLMLSFFDLDSVFFAVSKGEIAFVRYFIDRAKANLNVLNRSGISPLQFAIEKGNKQIVEALVQGGASPNFQNKKSQSALLYAVELNSALDIIALLLDNGADVNAKDEVGTTALHLAVTRSPEMVALLVSKGADLDVQDKGLRTALHTAVIEDQLQSVKVLVEKGANLELQDEEGFTALMTACWKKRDEIISYLISKKARLDTIDKTNRRSCLHLCVLRKDEGNILLLADGGAPLDQLNGSGYAPIHVATNKGYDPVVELLIAKGATVDIRDENFKQTALHIAAANNRPKLVEILLKACPSILDLQDVDGKTALLIAAENDNVAVGKLLLAAGAKVDLVDKNLDTPLHAAANKGGLEFGRMLLGHKSNPNIRNREGSQPIHIAAAKGAEDLVIYLVGAFKIDINSKNFAGNTPLHLAIMQKNFKVATVLCENGGALNILNADGNNPLFYAPPKMHSQLQEAVSRKV